jgi:hypothetical protein
LLRRLARECAILIPSETAEAEERGLAWVDDGDVAFGERPVPSMTERDVLQREAGDLAGLRRHGDDLLAVRSAVLAGDLGRDLARPLEAGLPDGDSSHLCACWRRVRVARDDSERHEDGTHHQHDDRVSDHEAASVHRLRAIEARKLLRRHRRLFRPLGDYSFGHDSSSNGSATGISSLTESSRFTISSP